MSVREAIRIVEGDGWIQVRQAGSHRQYHHPSKPGTVTIPSLQARHGDHQRQAIARPRPKDRKKHPQAGGFALTLFIQEAYVRFAILIEKTATGYSAHVPDLPGCVAAGETLQETGDLIREAIAFHLEGMRRHGEPWPEPSSMCEYVEVVAPA